ncbi:hypothetical protein IRP16_004452 [Salmonella enterica]|nr:hypothetical protein [Salmonella enterica]ELZ8654129.1 hypothetical protein [Salmonella enterica]
MDDNSTSVTNKEDMQEISLKNWLKNKKTIVLLIFTALTNIGNVLSTFDTIIEKSSSAYTWLGKSSKFEGEWSNNQEGYIDTPPEFLDQNDSTDVISVNLKIKDGEVRGELHTDARVKICETIIDEKIKTACKLIASYPFMIEGRKSPFSNQFDAHIVEWRNGKKQLIAILNMKIENDGEMVITNTMKTLESRTFPPKIYMIKTITMD